MYLNSLRKKEDFYLPPNENYQHGCIYRKSQPCNLNIKDYDTTIFKTTKGAVPVRY